VGRVVFEMDDDDDGGVCTNGGKKTQMRALLQVSEIYSR